MDLAEALNRKEVVEKAPGAKDLKVDERERVVILNDLITKGFYKETVEIPELNMTITFRTRSAYEDKIIREELEKDGIPQLVPDYLFKLGLYSLVFSLVELNGSPIIYPDNADFKTKLETLASRIPSPILTKILEEFYKFERKVLLAVDPNFLEKVSENTQSSEQGQKS